MEKKIEVKAYWVTKICDCGGEMESSDEVLMTDPPKYPHVCNKCRKKDIFEKSYPCIEYGV